MEDKIEIKIILDTNILFNQEIKTLKNSIENNNIHNLKVFIDEYFSSKKYDIKICIPEIVLEEKRSKIIQNIKTKENQIKEGINYLDKYINIKKKDIKINYQNLKTEKINNLDYEILKYPKIHLKTIIKRVLENKKPFCEVNKNKEEGKDKGFKDTILWMSILEDSKLNKKTKYILLSKDNIFFKNKEEECIDEKLKEEFKKNNNEDIEIFREISDLKIYFDEKFDLKLKLEEEYKKLKEKILKNIGSLTINIIKYYIENKKAYSSLVYESRRTYSIDNREKKYNEDSFKNYDFNNISNINIENIIDDNNYTFSSYISLKEKKLEEESFSFKLYDDIDNIIEFYINVKIKNEKINILNCTKVSYV